jgi:hypothetical protein
MSDAEGSRMEPIVKDGILTMLRLSNEALRLGEKRIALELLITAQAAMRELA